MTDRHVTPRRAAGAIPTLGVCLTLLAGASAPLPGWAYPLYGSEDRRIGRVDAARLTNEGELPGRKNLSGELLPLDKVDLRLLGHPDLDIPPADKTFSKEIARLLGSEANRYGIAVLDLTDPAAPRYAESGANAARNPGSVGKIAVGLALFEALANAWPDTAERMRVLRETRVTADDFIISDSHKVRMFDRDNGKVIRRPLRVGDTASLFEFTDWMMSASSNAAAAMVMREALLIDHAGTGYPPDAAAAKAYFEDTPRQEMRDTLARTLQGPMTRNGIDVKKFRQGSLFTRTGKRKVPGTNSYGTAREMLNFLLRMEQGRLVDEWSSRELKRLLYMTERRIRYASSPALRDAAVYFKSGSLYKCVPEEGFKCRKYHGNKLNLMNSIAIVEWPAENPELFYIVALNSNVLRKNSAVEHQTLGTRIHRLLQRHHGLSKKK